MSSPPVAPRTTPATRTAQWEIIINDLETEFSALAALGGNQVSYQREAGFALDLLRNNTALQKCTADSIRTAVKNVAAICITLNPAMKLAYLVPREGKCCLDLSAQGLLKIATDSGSILAAKAVIVYANDTFEYLGPFTAPVHKCKPFDRAARGDVVGVYVLAKLANGLDMVEPLDMAEIAKIRAKSRASNGPWVDWFEEMVKKSAIKRAYKSWPKTERLSLAEAVLNEHEGIELADAPAPAGVERARTQAAAFAQAAQQTVDSPERTTLVAELEQIVQQQGLDAYARHWQALTKEQRKMVGPDEHARIKSLVNVTDVEPVMHDQAAPQEAS